MAGAEFNLNVNGPDEGDAAQPVDPNLEDISGELPELEIEKLNKARIRLEKQIRDFSYQMDTLENRLNSQVVNLGAMAAQRARSAKDETRLEEVLSQILEKQKARLAFIQTTLRKSADTIDVKLKLSSEATEEDFGVVDDFKEGLNAEMAQAEAKINDEIDNLRKLSLEDIKKRREEKRRKEAELEAKRNKRRQDFENARAKKLKEKNDLRAARLAGKETEEETFSDLANNLSSADQLSMMFEEFAGRTLGINTIFRSERNKRMRRTAKDAAEAAYRKTLEERSGIPFAANAPGGPGGTEPPVVNPPAGGAGGGGGMFGGLGGRLGPIVSTAALLTFATAIENQIDKAFERINKRIESVGDLSTGSTPGRVFGSITSAIPVVDKRMFSVSQQMVETLDTIASNTERDIEPFSPEVIQANIDKRLMMLEQSINRADQMGPMIASIIRSRTELQQQAKIFADTFLDLSGPFLQTHLRMMTAILNVGTRLMAVADSYIDAVVGTIRSGKWQNLINPSFWINAFSEGMKRATIGTNTGNTVTGGPMENFFSARDQNNPASPANVGGGVKIP